MTRSPGGDLVPLGTCTHMCPRSEVTFRHKNHLLHPLECVDPSASTKNLRHDPSKMVKEYSRSAAGCNLLVAELLRPAPVLQKTVDYLLNMFHGGKKKKLGLVYSFVVDRFRAVRQDMVVQRLNTRDTVALLEKMIPFYLETEYLCRTRESAKFYDWKLHATQLEDCFSTWTACIPTEQFNPEILAASVLRDRQDLEPIYFLLPSDLRRTVLSLILSIDSGNFVRFFRLIKSLDSQILKFSLINQARCIRLRALSAISVGFKSRGAALSFELLSSWLMLDGDSDINTIASHFGQSEGSSLLLASLDLSKPIPSPVECVLCKYDSIVL